MSQKGLEDQRNLYSKATIYIFFFQCFVLLFLPILQVIFSPDGRND